RAKTEEAIHPRLGPAVGAIATSAGRHRTPEQILGPFFPAGRMLSASSDLTVVRGGLGRANGEIIQVAGRVLNRDGEPVRGARLVIWQANSFGRYTHPNDANPVSLDQDFVGFTEIQSDESGAWQITTVKPGSYAA